MILISTLDSVGNIWTLPLAFTSEGSAARAFIQACNGRDQAMTSQPMDFTLWEIGSFDDRDGKLVALPAPRRLMTGQEARQHGLKLAEQAKA